MGRAIFGALSARHEVVGVDRSPFNTTRHVADITDMRTLRTALVGVDAVIHCAALHAPHVGLMPDTEFHRINVEGTRTLAMLARDAGVSRFVFTSTTALYGHAIVPGRCTWVDERTPPQPRTVYHRSKLAAEHWLEEAASPAFQVRVIRMSRCFPETAQRMLLYRLHRGIDVRDVADAHAAALRNTGPMFQRYIASGATPFGPEDCERLVSEPRAVLAQRCVMCHGAALTSKGVRLDTDAGLRQHAQAVHQQAVVTRQMPMNNATGMTEAERALLAQWFRQGAPLE